MKVNVLGVAEKSKVSLIRGFKLIRKFIKFTTIKIYLGYIWPQGLTSSWEAASPESKYFNRRENKLTLRKTFYCVCGPTPTKVEWYSKMAFGFRALWSSLLVKHPPKIGQPRTLGGSLTPTWWLGCPPCSQGGPTFLTGGHVLCCPGGLLFSQKWQTGGRGLS